MFEHRTLKDIYDEIRDVYLRYPQPWVIGYSGGKDSTAVVQLVWKALEKLPPEDRQKPVFVIASDTKVETPVIVAVPLRKSCPLAKGVPEVGRTRTFCHVSVDFALPVSADVTVNVIWFVVTTVE